MSNFDRAVKALDDVDEAIDHLADNEAYVTALEAAGLLAPDVQVIRTMEELEALEPNDLLVPTASEGFEYEAVRADSLLYVVSRWGRKDRLPAVVVATGAQVRAAREAMEQEHD